MAYYLTALLLQWIVQTFTQKSTSISFDDLTMENTLPSNFIFLDNDNLNFIKLSAANQQRSNSSHNVGLLHLNDINQLIELLTSHVIENLDLILLEVQDGGWEFLDWFELNKEALACSPAVIIFTDSVDCQDVIKSMEYESVILFLHKRYTTVDHILAILDSSILKRYPQSVK